MKISLLQLDIKDGQPRVNQANVQNLLQEALLEEPDVIVLPELWNSGYALDKLEKIAMDAFKVGYEVSEAEEFEEENGNVLFCCDIISEVELKPEIIDAQQKELLPLVEKYQGSYDGWGTYFEDPNVDDDEYGGDSEFFDEDDALDDDD